MSETQHSQNKEPIIRFGPNDDTAKKVKNVVVLYKDGTHWDISKGQQETTYDRITILKDCNEIYFLFYINNNELMDELYIPIHNVRSIQVNHFPKPKVKQT